ncbi:MAG: isoprenyl transferase [Candidatus Omnitrophica bacterium]|nr:isoprenyl transferase [Candidatus Omnitrophota bacterium]
MEVPYHIAVIMDGNGRWARKRMLPRVVGHRQGAKRVKEILREAKRIGVGALTIFAFSTENWNRPKKEIEFIFSYLVKFLKSYQKEFIKKDIKFKAIGRRDRFSKEVIEEIKKTEDFTKDNKSFIFNVALDYGGKWDIVNATKKIAKKCITNSISDKDIDEELFNKHMSLGDIPAPDLLIRTSGEKRISNFLIWDLAYSEFYFTPIFWPEFDKEHLHKAIKSYSQRNRRFGAVQ